MESHNDDEDCSCRHDDCDCDLVEIWIEQNKAWHFEGDHGLKKLERLVETLGYHQTGFRFGNPIEVFLSDNPGACDAIVEFIREWVDRNSNWKERLRESVEEQEYGIEMEDE